MRESIQTVNLCFRLIIVNRPKERYMLFGKLIFLQASRKSIILLGK